MKFLTMGTFAVVGSWAIGMPQWFTIVALVLTLICAVGALLGIPEP